MLGLDRERQQEPTLRDDGSVMRSLAAGPEESRGTAGSDVLVQIRRDIIDGRRAPGEKLKFADLRECYDASMGALREALLRLAAEGIVTADEGRGFWVAEVSEADLLDLVALRVDIERRAIEDSVRHGDEDWEARVLTTWLRLSKVDGLEFADRFTLDKEWIGRHRDFHAALVSACRSTRILQFRAILYDQGERYRLLSMRHGPDPQDGEHGQLRDAALAKDAALAGDLLVKHIVDSADFVLRYAPQLATSPARSGKADG
jgi:GntR family carbon starvation induced transcriptional regulator